MMDQIRHQNMKILLPSYVYTQYTEKLEKSWETTMKMGKN